jgi:hypothetical protein
MLRLGSLPCLRLLNLLSLSAFHFACGDHRRKVRLINRKMMKKSRTQIRQTLSKDAGAQVLCHELKRCNFLVVINQYRQTLMKMSVGS